MNLSEVYKTIQAIWPLQHAEPLVPVEQPTPTNLYPLWGECGACGERGVPLMPVKHPVRMVCKTCVNRALMDEKFPAAG
jgi:hypothetical protein